MAEKFIEPVKPAEAKKQIEDLTKHAAKIVIPQISPETRSTKEIMRARKSSICFSKTARCRGGNSGRTTSN